MSESAAAALDPRQHSQVLVNTRKYFRISPGPTFTPQQVGAACMSSPVRTMIKVSSWRSSLIETDTNCFAENYDCDRSRSEEIKYSEWNDTYVISSEVRLVYKLKVSFHTQHSYIVTVTIYRSS